ncbi:hypothetical protein [Sinomonas terrae]|uniref:DUF1707 domain-containing protein n=1 Tax=Sinomonas terrae TaxID=2908838 RepID=A0ABS9TZN7_9MICC|nr:hypothetical protein [Sinomonas terrae]MCH6469727.1 hypothetical protein [Sinomonas terrae]
MERTQAKELASALRKRGVEESALPALLAKADEMSAEQGESFLPRLFAEQVPRSKHQSPGKILGNLAAYFGILALGGPLAIRLLTGASFGLPGQLVYLGCIIVILLALIFAAAALDRRLPPGWGSERESRKSEGGS